MSETRETGFTQEDVDELLRLAKDSEDADKSGDYYYSGYITSRDPAWCRSLADRIANHIPTRPTP